MIPVLCTLVLLALAGVLLLRAGAQITRAGATVDQLDPDRPLRAAAALDGAMVDVAAAIDERQAGRDRPAGGDR